MVSNAGFPRERRIAAAHQMSGFFVERGHRAFSSNLFEVDVIGTRYLRGLDRVLIETTRGSDGSSKPARALEGSRNLLGYERALYVTCTPIAASLELLTASAPLEFITVEDDAEIGPALVRRGSCPRYDAGFADAWVAAYEAIDALRQAIRRSAANEDRMGRRVKERLASIEAEVWIKPDLLDRLQILETQGWDGRLAQDAANAWYEKVALNRGMAALNDPAELRVNGAAYVQHLERLNYMKAVVHAAFKAQEDDEFYRRLRAIARQQLGYQFPADVTLALSRLEVARYAPSVVQTFFLGLGGFLWMPAFDEELEFLAWHAGCDALTARRAVEFFVRVVPYRRGWWRTAGDVRAIKWFPMHLHGVGAHMRDALHGTAGRWSRSAFPQWRKAFIAARQALDDPHGPMPRRPRRSSGRRTA